MTREEQSKEGLPGTAFEFRKDFHIVAKNRHRFRDQGRLFSRRERTFVESGAETAFELEPCLGGTKFVEGRAFPLRQTQCASSDGPEHLPAGQVTQITHVSMSWQQLRPVLRDLLDAQGVAACRRAGLHLDFRSRPCGEKSAVGQQRRAAGEPVEPQRRDRRVFRATLQRTLQCGVNMLMCNQQAHVRLFIDRAPQETPHEAHALSHAVGLPRAFAQGGGQRPRFLCLGDAHNEDGAATPGWAASVRRKATSSLADSSSEG
jgi:hypothetical protein